MNDFLRRDQKTSTFTGIQSMPLCLIVVEVLHDTWKKQQPFWVISHVIHYLVIVILYLVAMARVCGQ